MLINQKANRKRAVYILLKKFTKIELLQVVGLGFKYNMF